VVVVWYTIECTNIVHIHMHVLLTNQISVQP